jgi:acyl-ACP thioesterase
VLIRTWPASREGLFSCREFLLSGERGRLVGRASTSWAAVNIATRRPVRLNDHLPSYPLWPHRALDDDFASLPKFPEPAARELGFRVLRSDLDTNQHVNNTVYAGWALEAVPDEVASGCLTELEISFRAEALYGDGILSRCAVMDTGEKSCCLHQIVRDRDGSELARLRTRWKND